MFFFWHVASFLCSVTDEVLCHAVAMSSLRTSGSSAFLRKQWRD